MKVIASLFLLSVSTFSLACDELDENAVERMSSYSVEIRAAAALHGVPQGIAFSIAQHESCFNPYAVSKSGARGMMQMMPSTFKSISPYGSAFNVRQNTRAAMQYLKKQKDRFGSWELALAAYNAGPTAVKQHNGIPPYRETKRYVRKVLATAVEIGFRS